MLLSRDFRKIARENLRGRWFPAIVVGFLGGLLGAVMDVRYLLRRAQAIQIWWIS